MYDDSSHPRPAGESKPVDWSWDGLVPHLIHPTKVKVIEAMLWIGRPLSAADLEKVFDGDPGLGVISYHLKRLARPGILELVGTRQVRGAVESFYWLAEAEQR